MGGGEGCFYEFGYVVFDYFVLGGEVEEFFVEFEVCGCG